MSEKYCYDYPMPSITVDMVLTSHKDIGFHGKIWVLLIKRSKEPYKDHWALPGGYCNIDETGRAAAKRELKEETDIDIPIDKVYRLGVWDQVDRDPRGRVISIAHYSMVDHETAIPKAGDDAKEARWFEVNELPENIAFDHIIMISQAMNKQCYWWVIQNILNKREDLKRIVKGYK